MPGPPDKIGAMNAIARRSGAWLVDASVVFVVFLVMWGIASLVGDVPDFFSDENQAVLDVAGYLCLFLYRAAIELRGGDTLGRKVLGLHVEYGDHRTLVSVVKRNAWVLIAATLATVWHTVDVALWVLLVANVALDRDHRHVFERWAGTV